MDSFGGGAFWVWPTPLPAPDPGGGGGGDGPGTPQSTKPNCKDLSLDNPQTFWNDQFASAAQVQAYFADQGMTQFGWDGTAAGNAFIDAGINPGLAVGIINAETSFGNGPNWLSPRNLRDPFSSGGANFTSSLNRGLGVVTKIEGATRTDNTPLSALENRQNDLRGYTKAGVPRPGQLYSFTEMSTWLKNS